MKRHTKYELPRDRLDAFIFDLDGVITETQKLHSEAWKRMFDEFLKKRSADERPFDDSDYREYVDGKPRYDGVKDFLASRNISLPYGNKGDSTDAETICGLGNRKNKYFLEILQRKGPKVYQGSVDFIKDIRKKGVKTAIISSSRNCANILRATGTQDLFDARVDGNDLDSQGIAGKPDPAMFLEAAKRIDVKPDRSAIVEDSLAGVEAGEKGRFAAVIGVARAGNDQELRDHGATITVNDLNELKLGSSRRATTPKAGSRHPSGTKARSRRKKSAVVSAQRSAS